jgi:hypothetical protein
MATLPSLSLLLFLLNTTILVRDCVLDHLGLVIPLTLGKKINLFFGYADTLEYLGTVSHSSF